MKNHLLWTIIWLLSVVLAGCGNDTDTPEPAEQAVEQPVTQTAEEATMAAQYPAETAQKEVDVTGNLVPIQLELPQPVFIGTPTNIEGVERLEPPLGHDRPPFLAPEGVSNVALNKPVSSSEPYPFMGELPMIVDGDKEATDGSVVELGPFAQWVAIDLEDEYDIYAIVVWHYHRQPKVYSNVIVEVSRDPEFIDSTIVFNNDHTNSLGLGVGTDMNYVETAEGKLNDCKGIAGRYVRLWSKGNNQNDYNHYVEVEVYGK